MKILSRDPEPKDHFAHLKELRETFEEYLSLSSDPILEALQESGMDLVKIVLFWEPLYQLAQVTYENALKSGATIEEATQKAEEKKKELAAQVLKRKVAA